MGRPLRYVAAGAYYHVGTKGNNDSPIFLDDWDRIVFFRILRRVRRRYRWRLHASCLLGNHYHLVVETPVAISPTGCATSMASTPVPSTNGTVAGITSSARGSGPE